MIPVKMSPFFPSQSNMSPVAENRKMSLLPNLYGVSRSQSDTSYEGLASILNDKRGRRSSEWNTRRDDKMVLRPLLINLDREQQNSLLYRRLSKTIPSVARSNSMKFVKKIADSNRHRHRGSSIPSDGQDSAEDSSKQRNRGSSFPNDGQVSVAERTVSNRSLPLPGDESDFLRLRNFSVTSKGVINRGDSFRTKSSRSEDQEAATAQTLPVQESPIKDEVQDLAVPRKVYKVLLVGATGVGKSAMWKQFMTSEYICAEDFYATDREMARQITVVLNNEESQMEFEKEMLQDENDWVTRTDVDAYVIVYSVTDRRSYLQARHFLAHAESHVVSKAAILVGNKTDLARIRTVTTDEGKSLAKEMGCKFIETSVAINHQIDELLVGTLAQIRIRGKAKLKKKETKCSIYNSKASAVLKRILHKTCLKSKSCDNLHVL